MHELESTSEDLQGWLVRETLPLDLVASWENLCATYDALRFSDELTDSMRLEEFKWIIQQMNCFLTRIRKSLVQAEDCEGVLATLARNVVPSGKVSLENRKSLAFQKLRQKWVLSMMEATKQRMKGESDGWSGYGIE